jgi:3-methylfumaryl-CoA hydratase
MRRSAGQKRLARIAHDFHRRRMGREDRIATEDLSAWIGRSEEASDMVVAAPICGLIATLDSRKADPQPGEAAPLLAHWLYCLSHTPLAEAGPDGHARRGGFIPPVPLPRRMWAGSEIDFHRPLRIGATLTRRSTIAELVEKEGRAGPLVFVRVDHDYRDAEGPVVSERQSIVYREPPAPGSAPAPPAPAPDDPQWRRRIMPDPVLLFRYSALTFNSHRIHYDRDYATGVEGYPGLVVHGPLIATLLLHELAAHAPRREIARYRFRAVRPIFDTGSFDIGGSLAGDAAELFAADEAGALCMSATATFR